MATDIALPLMCVGKISATTTNVNGPKEIAKKEIYNKIPIKTPYPSTLFE